MALNGAPLGPTGQPVLSPGEKLFDRQLGVAFLFRSRDARDGYPGRGQTLECRQGSLYMTSRRLIYVPHATAAAGAPFRSLSVPIQHYTHVELKQPLLFAARIEGQLAPVVNGGIAQEGTAVFTFHSGGAPSVYAIYHEMLARLAGDDGDGGDRDGGDETLPAYEDATAASATVAGHGARDGRQAEPSPGMGRMVPVSSGIVDAPSVTLLAPVPCSSPPMSPAAAASASQRLAAGAPASILASTTPAAATGPTLHHHPGSTPNPPAFIEVDDARPPEGADLFGEQPPDYV
ncbi:hypothetical protein CXG81DRAFT_28877 [Caulochytrium protostelioides]|uniref:GRAM domain-containing protein n=1 Tax=Caulochytrium protostelioides TaxID=1555241 RepID=A0A4P9WXS6_9FUNG|nr:hypothetical protein CXG81DRAFT_28877 [Caulochytrium protostelioides]|eukprot:RKO98281.1 hypothetical protein CXG81DRAFT_28877 [Caulochytrium protostelioides]